MYNHSTGYLQVTHKHEISGSVPLVMEGEMVDVAQHGFGAYSVGRILGVDVSAESLHEFDRVLDILFFTTAFLFGWRRKMQRSRDTRMMINTWNVMLSLQMQIEKSKITIKVK